MKKKKNFDCVEMKRQIQKQILEKYKDMSVQDATQDQSVIIKANPILNKFWEETRKISFPSSR